MKVVRLTNRFHVAVRLFSNRSQMTSKCGKNKNVAHEAIAISCCTFLTLAIFKATSELFGSQGCSDDEN